MPEASPRISLTAPKQLPVEGREEELFFEAFARHLSISDLQVLQYKGKDKLRAYLRTFVATPGFEQVQAIGVVRDADSSATSAFQSVNDSLRAAGLSAPAEELVPIGASPKVVVLIAPGNSEDGALEDICLRAVEDDPAMDCVSQSMECVNRSVAAPPQNPSKAQIHAFLASRQDPELRLGEAAQRGYLPWEALAFDQLRHLLTML